MKAVALNASPRLQAGNTALILDPFIEGMRESGAGVELLYVRKFNCGFREMDNFDPLVAHLPAVCRNLGVPFAGALLRPHGEAMRPMIGAGTAPDDVFGAAREAGRQLAREGMIAPETRRAVSR